MDEIITVEELMVPLEEYAAVSEDASLYEAVVALEQAQESVSRVHRPYLHRAVLVYDKHKRIVGKVSQHDVLRSLEPRYRDIGDTRALSRAGLNPQFLKSIMQSMSFCDASLSDMCSKAARVKVKSFMHSLDENEHVNSNASLCEAIHQFIMGHHQSLLVVKDGEIVGILRVTDVFMKVFEMIKQCEM